jgi:hypothetical protein
MRVHRVTVYDPDEGICYVWGTSKRAALQAARKLRDELGIDRPPRGEDDYDLIVIEDRADLVRWLSTHFTHDNG